MRRQVLQVDSSPHEIYLNRVVKVVKSCCGKGFAPVCAASRAAPRSSPQFIHPTTTGRTPDMTRVLLEGVSKVFAVGVNALSEVNLEISSGELLALIGPSGCGKTTLLRLVAGLERATSGNVVFDTRKMNDVPPHLRNTAMVFQDEALQPHLSVRDNLTFGLKLRRRKWWQRKRSSTNDNLTNGEITQQINQAAAAVGIERLLDRMPQQLSGGQRQRVALGQAMVRQPTVLLLDEPLSQLDSRLRGELRSEIKQLQRRLNVTTIYVTHDQDEALALGDRIAVMSDGKLQQVGLPLSVYDRPLTKTVAEQLGDPPMNFITGKVQTASSSERLRFVGGGLQVELSAAQTEALGRDIGRHVELGVRPEHVQVRTVSAGGLTTDVDSLANITMVETLGDSTILRIQTKSDTESGQITCKRPGRVNAVCGDHMEVSIDAQQILIFDIESGALIAPCE